MYDIAKLIPQNQQQERKKGKTKTKQTTYKVSIWLHVFAIFRNSIDNSNQRKFNSDEMQITESHKCFHFASVSSDS